MAAATAGRGVTGPLVSHFLALLRGCSPAGHLKQAHALLFTAGLSQHLLCTGQFVLRSMQVLPNHGSSLLVLQRLDPPDAARIWNAAMREHLTRCRHEETVALFAEMLRCGVSPDEHTYPLLLKAVARSKDNHPAQIHARVVKSSFDLDQFVQNSLVSCYSNAGSLECAAKVFDGMSDRDPVAWTSMIHGYVKNNNMGREGLCLFSEMKLSGTRVDEVTIASVLSGCGILGAIRFGSCIHGLYVECGRVKRDVYVDSALVDMYAKCGYMDDAQKLFDEMPLRNIVSWTALITGYIHSSGFNMALDAVRHMLVEGFLPNEVTLASILTACAQLGVLRHGRCAHGYIKRHGLGANSVVGTALIDMYIKCGCINQALAVFLVLPQKDVHPWTAMISGFATHGRAPECLDLFSRMLDERVQPNEVTFVGILSACAHGGLVDLGRRYLRDMSSVYGIEPKLAHYGCIVDLLGRAGLFDEALQLIENMPMDPNPGVWGALFGACMIHRNFKLGVGIGEHLIKLQPRRSGRYALLANLFSEARKWEEAASVRVLMRRREVEKIPGGSWIEVNGTAHEFVSGDYWSHSLSEDVHQMLDAMRSQFGLEAYHMFDIVTG